MIAASACGGTPAWAQYRDHGQTPWALLMSEMNHTHLKSMVSYLDVETLFPRFGLPMTLVDSRCGFFCGSVPPNTSSTISEVGLMSF